MIIAIDVHYRENYAKAVSIEFENWEDVNPSNTNIAIIDDVKEYVSGKFYKRELPCIMKVLEQSLIHDINTVIIDGYVTLDDNGKKGLGKYVYEKLDEKIPIIGVAKKEFKNNNTHVRKVFRGQSKNPLYVTSVGIAVDLAAEKIAQMKGQYRVPDLLKILDMETKKK